MFSDVVYAMGGAPKDAGSEPGGTGAIFSSFLPLILIFVVFYFLLIRPQSKKAKEHKNTLGNLKNGDKIITTGGIYGVIEGIEDDTITLKIAENVKVKMSRSAVAGLREK
ncbi:MAG: preprotein translocase subunit YajC [Thermodesulfovibrionia bacterium]|nr:preprotein translocase subunit YajC [Thermodesulfovibrionia bacterium]